MEELSTLLVDSLVGVSSEIITLSLQQVGRETSYNKISTFASNKQAKNYDMGGKKTRGRRTPKIILFYIFIML